MSEMPILESYKEASPRLFAGLSGDADAVGVCVEHRKHLPCRRCMYQSPATRPYSNDPDVVAEVRRHQEGSA